MATVLNGTRSRRGYSVVLMARLVDRLGRAIGPADVRSIDCSLHRDAGDGASSREADVSRAGRALCIGKVLFAELRHDTGWDSDDAGYNFRHRVMIPRVAASGAPSPQPSPQGSGSRCYEVRYVFTQVTGEETVVRFRIRVTEND